MIHEVLAHVQQALKAPKDQKNDFGRYKYRSAERILEKVKPLLYESGAVLTLSDDIVSVNGWVYVRATATLDVNGESISSTAFAREEEVLKGMVAPQITGSSSSYARKYALNGLFAIDDSRDDPDTNDFHKKIAPEQDSDADAAKVKMLRTEIEGLTEGNADRIGKWIQRNIDNGKLAPGITYEELDCTALTALKVAIVRTMQRENPAN